MKKIIMYIFALILKIISERVLSKKTIFYALSIACINISGLSFLSNEPLWEFLLKRFMSINLTPNQNNISSYQVGFLFLFLSILFAIISYFLTKEKVEKLVDTKFISPEFKINNCSFCCYCGSITNLNGEAEVVVSSENTELSLGDISGTSISGRVRRMAAQFDKNNKVKNDYIKLNIEKWKEKEGHFGPYSLGQIIISDSYKARENRIKKVIHLIAIEKRNDGSIYMDEEKIREGINKAIKYSLENNYLSIFIPVFGIGSGRKSSKEYIDYTINPVFQYIKNNNPNLKIYFGTYRLRDLLRVSVRLFIKYYSKV